MGGDEGSAAEPNLLMKLSHLQNKVGRYVITSNGFQRHSFKQMVFNSLVR